MGQRVEYLLHRPQYLMREPVPGVIRQVKTTATYTHSYLVELDDGTRVWDTAHYVEAAP